MTWYNKASSLDRIKMTKNWLVYDQKIFTTMNLNILVMCHNRQIEGIQATRSYINKKLIGNECILTIAISPFVVIFLAGFLRTIKKKISRNDFRM